MNNTFINSYQILELNRFPLVNNNQLRSWDAADEYLLSYLHEEFQISCADSILIFNDSFGALSLALHKYKPITVTDSHTSKLGITHNQKINNINSTNIINSLTTHSKKYDYVLIKCPKSLDYLSYFISQIKSFISRDTVFLVAGMVKHIPKNLWNHLEALLGKTHTTPGKKKAKVIRIDIEKEAPNSPYPTSYTQEDTQNIIYNHANVFSKKSLDIGSRFLIQNLPQFTNINHIIDLGCGNGIIGLNLAQIYPEAQITFIDESYMAVDSAKLTIEKNRQNTDRFYFKVNYCLDQIKHNSADLIVCNPPFHQNQTIGIDVALKMFSQSQKVLTSGGKLIVIANSHLPYFSHLKRIFKHVKKSAKNNKFIIYSATK